MSDPILRSISLGAGVQSTTMALMAAHGELTPMPDCAVFADTGWEPKAVYEHLRWLMSANVLPFPVITTSRGNLRDDAIACAHGAKIKHGNRPQPPFHIRLRNGQAAMSMRQCTRDYKVVAIEQALREQMGVKPRQHVPAGSLVEVWIGISTDEAVRVKPARKPWQINRWPLIERRLSRADCLGWLLRNGYPRPPKSSCIGCPFHSDEQWLALPADEFADAVEFEREIQRGSIGFRGATPYLHRSLVPLDKVTFSQRDQADLFANECEGMCGV